MTEPTRKPARPWLHLTIIVLLTCASLYLVLIGTTPARDPARPAPPPRVAIAPSALYATSYPGTDGKPVALGKWQGKVVVLNFWATWCVPCREEMPLFDRMHKKWAGKGLIFVGLAADDQAKVATFLRASPVSYPILIGDLDALEFARRLGNKHGALPYTVILDRAGNVLQTKLGPFSEAELEAQVKTAL